MLSAWICNLKIYRWINLCIIVLGYQLNNPVMELTLLCQNCFKLMAPGLYQGSFYILKGEYVRPQ